MKCAALPDRINQMETSNYSPGSLVPGGGAGAHIERLEQRDRTQELEGKTWRRLTVKRESETEEEADVETLGHGWEEAKGLAGYLSCTGEEAAPKQCPAPQQARDVRG